MHLQLPRRMSSSLRSGEVSRFGAVCEVGKATILLSEALTGG
jgi:hypothetical protein